jgi:response regulator RpfG family c-di-GMP phosphodiesterase
MFDDELQFADEDMPAEPGWKILIVDDVPDVHAATELALAGFQMDGRPVEFLHAYSGAEARDLLSQQQDIALMYLDVVMETDDAGLQVVKWLRENLGNQFTRIVLRTGQPGQAPEEKVIVDYDINDYKEKTELTRRKLFTTTYSALRSYRDIMKVEEARRYQERFREGLERVIEASARVFEQRSLQQLACGLLQQVVSLLKLDECSMMVRLQGITALRNGDNPDIEILASIGSIDNSHGIPDNIREIFSHALEQQHAVFEQDCFVGYYPTKQGKINLLYMKGLRQLDDLDVKLLDIFSTSVSLAFENMYLNREIFDTQSELIHRLGEVVESRSPETGNHIRRMSELSYMLAIAHGLDEEEAELIRRAAPMHDIGKIATPDAILLKPGKLTAEEWTEMQRHPDIGFHLLKGSERPILRAAAIIAYQHHEKYDGSGYPQGLRGEEIHIYARIVAVADVFDALTHARCYKPAWTIEAAVENLQQLKSSHLDPRLVELLLQNLPQAEEIFQRYPE